MQFYYLYRVFGMAVMLLIIYLYYAVAVYPGAARPDPVVVYQDYVAPEYSVGKRDATYGPEEAYNEDNYYYNEPIKSYFGEDAEIARNKRENQTTPASPSTTPNPQAKSSKADKHHKGTTPSVNATTTPQEEEEVLDFKLSNSFVDAIQAHAEHNRIKEPLGLCRRNTDINMPSMNVTLFPLEQAEEIITCINDILTHQSKKRLCIELNEEMSAYLKWLILTGDSKERRKQIKISAYHDDFLFPTTCGAKMPYMEGLTEYVATVKTHEHVETKIRHEGEVRTTCDVVTTGKH